VLKQLAITFCVFLVVGFASTRIAMWSKKDVHTPTSSQISAHVQDQRTATQKFEEWLKTEGTPEDRHLFVLGANWDFTDIKLFEWIASQPDCDKSTALVLFWKGQGDYYAKFDDEKDVPDVNIDGYRLTSLIRQRWLDGKYTRSAIAFEMEKDVWKQDFSAIDKELGSRALERLPASMRQDISGKRPSDNCCTEGIPNRFWPKGGGRI
jgi:hypothetical protein